MLLPNLGPARATRIDCFSQKSAESSSKSLLQIFAANELLRCRALKLISLRVSR